MVPSRLGGPSLGPPNPLGIFIANVSFWPWFFVVFFFSKAFLPLWQRQCRKGRKLYWAWGRRWQTPFRSDGVKQDGFEGCDDAFGSWSQTMATGADAHMSTTDLCEAWVGHVLNPAQMKYQAVQQISSGFSGFLEEKLCAVLTSAWARGYRQREESHCRQVPVPSLLPSASLQW